MKVYDHFLDSVSMPRCIRLSDNLWALRFESMKIASCATAVQSLLNKGVISGDTTLVDSSSGIYAYALALTCHKYHLRCHIIASTTVDKTLLFQLRSLGATVNQVPASTNLKYDQELRVKLVHEYLAEHPKAYWMRQYHDHIHYEGYRKIGEQLQKTLIQQGWVNGCNLVAPVGSGASSAGLYAGLAADKQQISLIGIQPFGSISFGSQKIEDPDILVAGIGSAIQFDNIQYRLFDDIHWVDAAIARQGTIQLLKDSGIFAGFSSGASYAVARYIADANPEQLTLFPCPDMGYRYAPLLEAENNPDLIAYEPYWINNLDDLRLPWSAMHWLGRRFDTVSNTIVEDRGSREL